MCLGTITQDLTYKLADSMRGSDSEIEVQVHGNDHFLDETTVPEVGKLWFINALDKIWTFYVGFRK